MSLPVRMIDPPDCVHVYHDFSSAKDVKAFLDRRYITNCARVPPYALNFVRIIRGQKLDESVVDGAPKLVRRALGSGLALTHRIR